jgi:hypothetical protein
VTYIYEVLFRSFHRVVHAHYVYTVMTCSIWLRVVRMYRQIRINL